MAIRGWILVVATLAACAGDEAPTPAAPGTPPPPPSTSQAPAREVEVDAGPVFPLAEGDPCRGLPLPVPDAGTPSFFVAPGFCASVVASGVGNLRQLFFAPNGDLFGADFTVLYLLRDADGDGVYAPSEIHTWARPGGNANNGHLDGDHVYSGSPDGVRRFRYDAAALAGGPPEDVVVGQPPGGHAYHTVHVYDGWLYVHSGSAGNATNETSTTSYDTKRSIIKRFDLSKFVPGAPFSWDAGEPFTLGLRNANGFTRNETTKKLYAVVNGLDAQVHDGVSVVDDNPGEQIVELAAGKTYGYPFCFTAQRILTNGAVVPAGTQLLNQLFASGHDDAWCATHSEKPASFVQAHSAPLDIAFFDRQPRGALPERWRGGAFIALHGSSSRVPSTGYKVVWQPFAADGSSPMPASTATGTTFPSEVVFGGGGAGRPEDGLWSWKLADGTRGEAPRPAGVAVGPRDGALYVTSDVGGYLYRVGRQR